MPRPAKGARLWLEPEERDASGNSSAAQRGSSETEREKSARAALEATAKALNAPLPTTSRASTKRRAKAVVIPLKSSSSTS